MSDFDTFWARYPRKKGKGAARRAWEKATRIAGPEDIMAGLESQIPELTAKEPQYRPYPATWLHQERWEDEPDEQRYNVGLPDYRGSQKILDEIAARRSLKVVSND